MIEIWIGKGFVLHYAMENRRARRLQDYCREHQSSLIDRGLHEAREQLFKVAL
jgi:hypothetical protein